MNIELKAAKWLLSEDTGSSSMAICRHMLFGKQKYAEYPSDPSDIGRCFRLLAIFPEWESRINEMACYGTAWISLSERWVDVKECMGNEVGIDWSKGDRASKTFSLMNQVIADGYRRDKNYVCTFNEDGTLSSATRIRN